MTVNNCTLSRPVKKLEPFFFHLLRARPIQKIRKNHQMVERKKIPKNLQKNKKISSPTGNRTPGTTVRAWNVTNYTIEEDGYSNEEFFVY
jgi:hypothetical protein